AGCGDDVSSHPDGGGNPDASIDAAPPNPDGPPAPASCAPLPAPTGTIVDVGPADNANLPSIIGGAPAGATIRFASGTYLTVPRLNITTAGLTLRSASGNPADVILDGNY